MFDALALSGAELVGEPEEGLAGRGDRPRHGGKVSTLFVAAVILHDWDCAALKKMRLSWSSPSAMIYAQSVTALSDTVSLTGSNERPRECAKEANDFCSFSDSLELIGYIPLPLAMYVFSIADKRCGVR